MVSVNRERVIVNKIKISHIENTSLNVVNKTFHTFCQNVNADLSPPGDSNDKEFAPIRHDDAQWLN